MLQNCRTLALRLTEYNKIKLREVKTISNSSEQDFQLGFLIEEVLRKLSPE